MDIERLQKKCPGDADTSQSVASQGATDGHSLAHNGLSGQLPWRASRFVGRTASVQHFYNTSLRQCWMKDAIGG